MQKRAYNEQPEQIRAVSVRQSRTAGIYQCTLVSETERRLTVKAATPEEAMWRAKEFFGV